MMKSVLKSTLVSAAVAGVCAASIAEASHFRGGALVPQIDSAGLLSVTATSFWRTNSFDSISSVNSSSGPLTQTSSSSDNTDSRFTIETAVFTQQLSGAQTVTLDWDSCCRVQGIVNHSGNSSVSEQLNSQIVWDGTNASAPILFDFSAIQSEVVRGANYVQNLNALSGNPGVTLTYDQILNNTVNGAVVSSFSQAPGFVIDPVTGLMTIGAADTVGYTDNTTANIGADYFFSGNINASDGSSVEFDWLFDSVGTASNLAPVVDDLVINALVGDNISQLVTGIDPEGGALTWNLLSFLGTGSNGLQSFNPATQLFSWNTTGSAVGTYIANVRAADPLGLTDTGTVTINLTQNTNPNPVPEPATALLAGLGAICMGFARRKRKQK